MTKIKGFLIGDKKVDNLEQTFIENLKIYKDLIKQINLIQPELYLSSVLKENICWIIGNLEYVKYEGKLIFYDLKWRNNALEITFINLKREIIIVIINLIRNRFFHEDFNNNIQIQILGVSYDQ